MKRTAFIILLTAGILSCDQASKSAPGKVQAETIHSARKYHYIDSMGKSVIIENGGPKGGPYTNANGKKYFKTIFWTRITNETEYPLEFRIDFPASSFELSSLPGKYFKIIAPPDTMTLDQEALYEYGLTGLQSFLDNSIDKPSSLKRTINPKGSSAFYVLILFDEGVAGPFRAGLSIKGQDLFYKISRYDITPSHAVVDEKEINCGRIGLRNLVLKK